MIEDILRRHNIKVTPSRLEVLSVLQKDDLTIKDIIKKFSNIDASTIYRTLELFLEKNIINKYISANKVYYTYNNHTHYLCCINCNKKIKLDKCPFDTQQNFYDFLIVEHTLTLRGICKNCQNSQNVKLS